MKANLVYDNVSAQSALGLLCLSVTLQSVSRQL